MSDLCEILPGVGKLHFIGRERFSALRSENRSRSIKCNLPARLIILRPKIDRIPDPMLSISK